METDRLALPDIRRIFQGQTVSGLSEHQLLERYQERRDEIAFEALLARHAPMVLGVCRRMLDNPADIDDAFQATFLVLVRRAGELGPHDAIGPWLYGVAARVALRARADAARRRRIEPIADLPSLNVGDPQAREGDRELAAALDLELARLPSKYRSPLVLCYMEGQTHEEAARLLNWPLGTVKGRLARARDLLRSRLARRGFAPAGGGLALVLARDARAAVPRELFERTITSCLKVSLGQTTAQVVSSSVASLVEGVLKAMLLNKLRWAGTVVLVSGLALTGAGVLARQGAKPQSGPSAARPANVATGSQSRALPGPQGAVVSKDASRATEGDSSPADPRRQLARAARAAWEVLIREYASGKAPLDQVFQASDRLLDVERQLAQSKEEAVSAIKDHHQRIKEIARLRQSVEPSSRSRDVDIAQLKVHAAQADLLLAEAKETKPEIPAPETSSPEPAASFQPQQPAAPARKARAAPLAGRVDQDPDSQRVLGRLNLKLAMNFDRETPLDDVLKYIKTETKSSDMPGGIPIYIDPIGLQEAEKTVQSTVLIDVQGVPLWRTLQLLLRQLGLIYWVQDGMIYITSEESEDELGMLPGMLEPSPIMEMTRKAERGELSLKEMKDLAELYKARQEVMRLSTGEGNSESPTEAGAIRRVPPNPPRANQVEEELKKSNEQMTQLLKEMHELIELLKAERQSRKAPAPK